MLGFAKVALIACSITSVLGASTTSDADTAKPRPSFLVPTLTQIRDILSQLEAPIISALTERANLATDPSLYSNGGKQLLNYLKPREQVADALGRYAYGKLEYPYTLMQIPPDVTTRQSPFPPGRFHQDSTTGNSALLTFYINTVVPLFNSTQSYYFHLDNTTRNDDAALNLDATILALLSHRSCMGKIVAESKYAADVSGFTPLIKKANSSQIRVLLTNTTQEAGVLAQAATAAAAFSTAWITSGALEPLVFPGTLANIAAKVFRELIDVTTDIEIQYLLERFN